MWCCHNETNKCSAYIIYTYIYIYIYIYVSVHVSPEARRLGGEIVAQFKEIAKDYWAFFTIENPEEWEAIHLYGCPPGKCGIDFQDDEGLTVALHYSVVFHVVVVLCLFKTMRPRLPSEPFYFIFPCVCLGLAPAVYLGCVRKNISNHLCFHHQIVFLNL